MSRSQHPDAPPAATFAGMTPRRLSAEQLLDAIGQVTEIPTKFRGVPLGQSAVQVVDPNGGNRFLDLFGRPDRDSVCTCERREEPTLNQVLHLINGATIEAKVRSADGRLVRLLGAETAPEQVLDELFLAAYGRRPCSAGRTGRTDRRRPGRAGRGGSVRHCRRRGRGTRRGGRARVRRPARSADRGSPRRPPS